MLVPSRAAARRMALRLWPLLAAFVILAALAVTLFSNRYGRAAATSALILPDMLVPLPLRPVTWLTDDPIREHVTLRYAGKTMPADVYRPPGDEPHGAIIFVMGAPPLDLDDERLVKLAEDAARAGAVFLVPFSHDLDRELILPEEPQAYVAGFQLLERLPYVDAKRIGMIGVSVGGSLALLAAADPAIAGRVDFVIPFGAYYDALDVLEAVTTRSTVWHGDRQDWDPRLHTIRVMSRQLIQRLEDALDRRILARIFERWEEPSEADLAALTPQGRAAYDFLANRDPARVQELMSRLPADALDDMRLLSPSRNVDQVQAEVFILHDRGDRFIPFAESRRLRDRLAGRTELHYTELKIFEHVEPNPGTGVITVFLDGSRLYFHLYQLLLRLS